MSEKEKELLTLLVQYKQYAYDLDRLLQSYITPQAYKDMQQRGILLDERLRQVTAPAQG